MGIDKVQKNKNKIYLFIHNYFSGGFTLQNKQRVAENQITFQMNFLNLLIVMPFCMFYFYFTFIFLFFIFHFSFIYPECRFSTVVRKVEVTKLAIDEKAKNVKDDSLYYVCRYTYNVKDKTFTPVKIS